MRPSGTLKPSRRIKRRAVRSFHPSARRISRWFMIVTVRLVSLKFSISARRRHPETDWKWSMPSDRTSGSMFGGQAE